MQSMGPEQLFRLVLNSGETNLDVVSIAEQSADFEKRMQTFVDSNHNLTKGMVAAGAVAATAAFAYAAYNAMANRLNSVQDERENYQDMIDQGISTYFIAKDRQKRHAWDHYTEAYIQALRGAPHPTLGGLVWRYAGIHQKSIEQEKYKGTVYGVMSTFATPLGAYFPQTADDSDALTQARKSLNLFILGELKEKLTEVEAKLKPGWLTNIKLVTEAERFLPWLNATRILLISLGNIGSNVLFSMNPNTNMPLSYQHSAQLCGIIRDVLGHMRTDTKNTFSEHRDALCCHESFDDFLAIFDSKILALKKAYELNAETKLNLNELSNSMHLILQQLNLNFRSLVYLNQSFTDPVHLNSKIIYLADLIYFHPELINIFIPMLKLPKNFDYAAVSVNNPPTTVIDILILWGNLPKTRRRGVLSAMLRVDASSLTNETTWWSLNKSNIPEWQRQFVKTLLDIDKNFIRPIERKSKPSHFYGLYHETKTVLGPAQLFLISSIAMSMEIYRLHLVERRLEGLVGVNQQILIINKQATQPEAIYGWQTMLSLLNLEAKTRQALITMFQVVYKILPLLKLVDLLTFFSERNQRIANTEDFQHVLVVRLQHLLMRKKELLKFIKALIGVAQDEKKSHKDLLKILTSLDDPNSKTSLSISQIAEEFDREISHSIRLLEDSVYDEREELEEHDIIDMLESLDNPAWFASQERCDHFYKGLRAGIRSRQLLMAQLEGHQETAQMLATKTVSGAESHHDDAEHVNLGDSDMMQAMHPKDSMSTLHEENISHAFQWKVLSTWIQRISMAMLLLGLFAVLFMAFGSQTIPAIAALSAPVATGLVIAGLVTAVSGGIGLTATYYSPRLFSHVDKTKRVKIDTPIHLSSPTLEASTV